MNVSDHIRRRLTRFSVVVALVILALSSFWSYRVQTAEESAQFAPAPPIKAAALLPAGTPIQAVIRNGIASAAVAGDAVTAFVSAPIASEGRLVIPSGAELKGTIEELYAFGSSGRTRLNFTLLFMGGQSFPIQARTVVVMTPMKSDAEILATAFTTLVGATLGAALGASSGDMRLVDNGLLVGGTATLLKTPKAHITVTLTGGLKVNDPDTMPQPVPIPR